MLVIIVCVSISRLVGNADVLQMTHDSLNAGLRATRRDDLADF